MDIVNEVWKDITGYEGFYQVSNFGRVKGCDRVTNVPKGKYYDAYQRHCKSRIMILKLDRKGYFKINLTRESQVKEYSVHRLVAFAFVDGYFDGAEVNHIDACPTNNHASNLEYVTRKGNMAHAAALGRMEKGSDRHNAKLKESDIPEIRSRLALGHSQRKIARDYSVHQRVIWLIANDKSWRHA
jgi:hypothetical protein